MGKQKLVIILAGLALLIAVVAIAVKPTPTPEPEPHGPTAHAASSALPQTPAEPDPSKAASDAPAAASAPKPKSKPDQSAVESPASPPKPAAKAPEPAPQFNPNELPPGHPTIAADEKTQVSIQWFGHSCFYIHTPGGKALVTDPFDPKATGLPAADTGAHLVTVSTEDAEHNYTAAVHPFRGEELQVVRNTGLRVGDLHVTPVPLSRDAGGRGGKTTGYVIEAGALRIAHLGDLGGKLTAQQLQALGKVDILMIPIGGKGLGPREAVEVVKQIQPKIVLPMAYRMEDAAPMAGLRSVDDFVAASPFARTEVPADVMLISKPELPESTEIYTMRK